MREEQGQVAGSHAWGGLSTAPQTEGPRWSLEQWKGEEHLRGSREKRDNWRQLDDSSEGLCFRKEQRNK